MSLDWIDGDAKTWSSASAPSRRIELTALKDEPLPDTASPRSALLPTSVAFTRAMAPPAGQSAARAPPLLSSATLLAVKEAFSRRSEAGVNGRQPPNQSAPP